MKMARDAGMSVPKVISCRQHFVSFGNIDGLQMFSILMTRFPEICLINFDDDTLNAVAEEPWLEELKECVHVMRQWSPPDENSICSPIVTAIRSS